MVTTPLDFFLLCIVIVLMFVNWGIESYKWQFLIKKVEKISFTRAVKAIFAGACISIFTPNRLGEFGGRIFYVNRTRRMEAILITLLGNMGQLLIAIVFGLLSLLVFIQSYHVFMLGNYGFPILEILVLLIGTVLFWSFFNVHLIAPLLKKLPKLTRINLRKKYQKKWSACADVFALYSRQELTWLLFVCFTRFAVYCIQFYLLLFIFGVPLPLLEGLVLISMCFFALTVIPTITLAELGIRGSVAIYFIGILSHNDLGILTASMSLWAINLAIPALIGSYFIYGLKIFSSNKTGESNSGQITPVPLG